MKKLKLKALKLGARELLSREQLRNVFGGSDGGSQEEGSEEGSGCNTHGDNFCSGVGPSCCVKENGKVYYGTCAWTAIDHKYYCSVGL